MSDLEKAIKIRGTLRSTTTNVIKAIEAEIQKRTPDLDVVEEKLMQLKEKERKLLVLNDQVQDLLDESQVEAEVTKTEEVHDIIISYKFKATKLLQRAGGKSLGKDGEHGNGDDEQGSSCGSSCRSQAPSVRLPLLEIKKFSGDPSQWQEFWSQYETVIHRAEMEPSVKFTYLRSYLEGKAARAITGLQPTNLNYDTAVKILMTQFGSKNAIIGAHMHNLLRMPKVKDSSDVCALRNLYDHCEIQIRSLENLGVTTSAYSALLSPVLMELIPEDIVIAFNREFDANAEWGVDDLCRFLLREVSSRERAAPLTKPRKTDNELKRQNPEGNGSRFRQEHRPKGSFAALSVTSSSKFCIFCDASDHFTTECEKFSPGERRAIVKRKRRCYNCLREGHQVGDCRSRFKRCKYCNRKHHFTLCNSRERESDSQTHPKSTENSEESPATHPPASMLSTISSGSDVVLLQTALATVKGPVGRDSSQLRCLLDSGSQLSFIKEEDSRRLQLEVIGEEPLRINHFGSEAPVYSKRKKVRVVLSNIHEPNRSVSITAFEIPEICGSVITVPSREIVQKMQSKGLIMADFPNVSRPNRHQASIEILIGSDFYWEVVRDRHERLGSSTVAIETILGWTVQGPSTLSVGAFVVGVNSVTVMRVAADRVSEEELVSNQLRAFWDLDIMGVKPEELDNSTDTDVLDFFNQTVNNISGRYQIHLPWKPNKDSLGDNLAVATKRTRGLLNKLACNPVLLREYDDILRNQLQEGIIEEVNSPIVPKLAYYLPHRAVIRKDSSTTKVRIVYDASSHGSESPSLNDVLESGPNLNPELIQVLLRFREHRIAFTSDIEKAFLQISVKPTDRDALRFLWTTDIENPRKAQLKVLRITRVPFGVTCSPFLLVATLRFHIRQFEEQFEETCRVLTSSLYVDDLLSGADEVEKAFKISEESKRILKEAGMNLRKWNTNAPELRKLWGEHSPRTESSSNHLANPNQQKILGLIWNSQEDSLSFEINSLIEFLLDKQETKRWVLKSLARIYDPLGLLSPFTVRAKFLYQQLWVYEDKQKRQKLKWDDSLPEELAGPFNSWCAEISSLRKLKIPRFYFSGIHESSRVSSELHCYVDASEKGFAAAVYLRYRTDFGEIGARLVAAKTRVTPISKLSIPRLELMGAVLGTRLVKSVENALIKKPVAINMWTDSTIVLSWIRDDSSTWRPFVSNRIRQIQDITDPKVWNYCPTKDNPADLPTRGRSAEDLLTNLKWWRGPQYLSGPASEIPYGLKPNRQPFPQEVLDEMKPEARLATQGVVTAVIKIDPPLNLVAFSSITKVFRVTAYVMRFLRRKKRKQTGPLSAEEIHDSEKLWIKITQRESFPSEIIRLQANQEVDKESSIRSLCPELDADGLLVISGRLRTKSLTYHETHPWILPNNHRFSELLAQRCHEHLYHAGVNDVLVELRENYWIIRARQLVKKVVAGCLMCRRFRVKPGVAKMAPLPEERTTPTPPFNVIGLDFAGPLHNRKHEKCYFVLFTCAVTRGIHLEFAENMSAECFLLAFRRFAARRAIPTVIYSDNAKSFKRANEDLKEIFENLKNPEVVNYFSNLNVSWRFIVDRAPWVGGFYERLNRSVKKSLKQTFGNASLSNVELTTVLAEVEATINSRPITFVSQEAGDPIPLTPAHFLTGGGRLTVLPSRKFGEKDIFPITRETIRIRYKHQQALLERLWSRWKREYLLELRTVHHLASVNTTPEFQVGDVVIVEENKMPRLCWKVAVVEELFRGRDNIVRSCMLRLSNGTRIKRPIKLLYNLEISDRPST